MHSHVTFVRALYSPFSFRNSLYPFNIFYCYASSICDVQCVPGVILWSWCDLSFLMYPLFLNVPRLTSTSRLHFSVISSQNVFFKKVSTKQVRVCCVQLRTKKVQVEGVRAQVIRFKVSKYFHFGKSTVLCAVAIWFWLLSRPLLQNKLIRLFLPQSISFCMKLESHSKIRCLSFHSAPTQTPSPILYTVSTWSNMFCCRTPVCVQGIQGMTRSASWDWRSEGQILTNYRTKQSLCEWTFQR